MKNPEPRKPTQSDAGDGQGTSDGKIETSTQNRPIMDGSTEPDKVEKEVPNTRRGMNDPGLIRHPEQHTKNH